MASKRVERKRSAVVSSELSLTRLFSSVSVATKTSHQAPSVFSKPRLKDGENLNYL